MQAADKTIYHLLLLPLTYSKKIPERQFNVFNLKRR